MVTPEIGIEIEIEIGAAHRHAGRKMKPIYRRRKRKGSFWKENSKKLRRS